MMSLLLSAAEFLKIIYDIVSYRHLIKPPGQLNYLTLYYPFLIDLPHDSLIFSIYILRHDDLSGD